MLAANPKKFLFEKSP